MQMTIMPTAIESALTEGRHPGYLLNITEEPTPPEWPMAKSSPQLWRWHFALWEVPGLIEHHTPELQTGITSTKFAPKGKFQASKAYVWTCQLLQRQIAPGESVNYDPLYPLPCSVRVTREVGKDYVKIVDVEAWPEGAALLTDTLRAALKDLVAQSPTPPPDSGTSPVPVRTPPPAPAPQPGMQSWGNQGQLATIASEWGKQ
jgi:hypothetical protein